MDLGLKGKNAAISGSSQGIGNAIAMALAAEGCNVAISGRNDERIEKAVAEAKAKGVKAVGIKCDFSKRAGCEKFVEDAVAGLGGLDILVNNVGGMIPGTLDGLTEEQWSMVLNTNLMAYVWTTRAAIPHLKKSKAGRILNVSGVSGTQLMPGALTTSIPNSAIIAFSKLMAADLGPHGITVNNINPGMTATDSWGPRAEAMAKVRNTTADGVRQSMSAQTLLGRWAEPREIGEAAAFLVSERNSYMTGATIEVDGGYTKYI
ncbi:MAG: SDR family oxidoreductase [Burkholderiales bacterium]